MGCCHLWHLHNVLWAPVAAIMVMQANIGGSLIYGLQRLAGTAVGSIIGGAIAAWCGVNEGTFFAAVVLCMLACSIGRIPDAARMAGVALAAVMMTAGANPWDTAVARFAENLLGIGAGMLVATALWPVRARALLTAHLATMRADCLRFYQALIAGYAAAEPVGLEEHEARIRSGLAQAARLIAEMRVERPHEVESVSAERDAIRVVFDHLLAMAAVVSEAASDTLQHALRDDLQQLSNGSEAGWQALMDHYERLRGQGVTSGKPLPEVLRLYTFLHEVRGAMTTLRGSESA